jgi:hypothetical protein
MTRCARRVGVLSLPKFLETEDYRINEKDSKCRQEYQEEASDGDLCRDALNPTVSVVYSDKNAYEYVEQQPKDERPAKQYSQC